MAVVLHMKLLCRTSFSLIVCCALSFLSNFSRVMIHIIGVWGVVNRVESGFRLFIVIFASSGNNVWLFSR